MVKKYSRSTKIEAARSVRQTTELWEYAYFPKKFPKSRKRRAFNKALENWKWLK
jgi:hypothetical protein